MGNTNLKSPEQIANEQNVYRTTRWMARGALGTGIVAVILALSLTQATCDQPLSPVLGVLGAVYLIYGILKLMKKPPSTEISDRPANKRWMISAVAMMVLWLVAMVYVWLSKPCGSVASDTSCCDPRLVTGTKFCVLFFASWYVFCAFAYACCWHKKVPESSSSSSG